MLYNVYLTERGRILKLPSLLNKRCTTPKIRLYRQFENPTGGPTLDECVKEIIYFPRTPLPSTTHLWSEFGISHTQDLLQMFILPETSLVDCHLFSRRSKCRRKLERLRTFYKRLTTTYPTEYHGSGSGDLCEGGDWKDQCSLFPPIFMR